MCAKKPKSYTHDKTSDQCNFLLKSVFGITTGEENDTIYPPLVCNHCYLTMRQLQLAKGTGCFRDTDLVPHEWSPHTTDCQLCSDPITAPRGRPRKRKPKGRPSDDDTYHWLKKTLHHLNNLHTCKYADRSLEVGAFLPTTYLDNLLCRVCNMIPNEPVQIKGCQHVLCKNCVCSACEREEAITCCTCNTPLTPESLQLPSGLVSKCLDSLLIRCIHNCGQILELQHLAKHLESRCTHLPLPSPSKVTTVGQLLSLETDNPSQLQSHTTNLLVEKLVPPTLTCRSSTGKVYLGYSKCSLYRGVLIS